VSVLGGRNSEGPAVEVNSPPGFSDAFVLSAAAAGSGCLLNKLEVIGALPANKLVLLSPYPVAAIGKDGPLPPNVDGVPNKLGEAVGAFDGFACVSPDAFKGANRDPVVAGVVGNKDAYGFVPNSEPVLLGFAAGSAIFKMDNLELKNSGIVIHRYKETPNNLIIAVENKRNKTVVLTVDYNGSEHIRLINRPGLVVVETVLPYERKTIANIAITEESRI
jgi:hypothetical protein